MKAKLLFVLIILLSCFCGPQINSFQKEHAINYKNPVTKKDVLMYSCQFISGYADGVNRAIMHHELGEGTSFWHYANSWKNEYKNFDQGDKRPTFFGFTTFAVGFMDGFHLTRLVDRAFTLGSLGFAVREKQSFKSIANKVVISALTKRAGFLLFFNVIYPGAM